MKFIHDFLEVRLEKNEENEIKLKTDDLFSFKIRLLNLFGFMLT
jgi:hypothetical protein